MERTKAKVIFRVDKQNIVFALFPELPGTRDPDTCTVYEHVGQHSSGDYALLMAHSRPATLMEYRSLARELYHVGYDLEIKTRDARAAMRKARVKALNK
jgi:hypothetical protein